MAGFYTHTHFVHRAIEELASQGGTYSELTMMLQRNGGIVNYGALFPDIGYAADSNWAESLHDTEALRITYRPGDPYKNRHRAAPPFRKALISQVGQYSDQLVAFLFGLISHQEADTAWHWGGYGGNGLIYELMKRAGAPSGDEWKYELSIDQLIHHYHRDYLVDFDFLTDSLKTIIRAASSAAGHPAPNPGSIHNPFTGGEWNIHDPIDDGQLAARTGWAARIMGDIPQDEMKKFVEEYEPGGIRHGAKLTAAAWMDTWDECFQRKDRLNPGHELCVDQYVNSSDKRYKLIMQGDGNLVLYSSDNKPLWASGTSGKHVEACVMQEDGNLVLYEHPNRQGPIWSSQTPEHAWSHLVVQNNGNVVIYDPGGTPIWDALHQRK